MVLLRHLHPPDSTLGANVGVKKTTSKLLVLVELSSRDHRNSPVAEFLTKSRNSDKSDLGDKPGDDGGIPGLHSEIGFTQFRLFIGTIQNGRWEILSHLG
ncbi:hypothetical protein CHELA40_14634 [Chelatococcus asaccharovorans]|nr:hypothetical protein CHELA17_60984 [Chelatococcus asaccharovorans]CAH1678903.1 hypothetical protein CHELA40_14634 [Chelatococcus asaccharovorans]